MMTWLKCAVSAVLILGVTACGPDLSGSSSQRDGGSSLNAGGATGATSGLFSCETVANGMRMSCTDYQWAGGAYSTASWSSACSAALGRAGTGCSRSSSAGGCRITTPANGVTITTTTWFFPDAYPPGTNLSQAVRMACTTGTVVSP